MFDFFDLVKYKKETKELKRKLDKINLTLEETKYLNLSEEIDKLEKIKKIKQSEVDILKFYIKQLTKQVEKLQDEIEEIGRASCRERV